MRDHENHSLTAPQPAAWNKGKLIGAKPPLHPKHVWSIRTYLQIEGRTRDLAMFNVAIDSSYAAAMSSPSRSRTWLRTDMQWIGRPCVKRRLDNLSGSN
jgi:hypothetical protein